MNAFEIPGLRFSLPAGGDVARHRFVSANADSEGIQATASTAVIGASMNQAAKGEVLEIADGIVVVEAAGAVTAGTNVSSDANGKVTTAGSVIAGIALTGATDAGQFVAVKII